MIGFTIYFWDKKELLNKGEQINKNKVQKTFHFAHVHSHKPLQQYQIEDISFSSFLVIKFHILQPPKILINEDV